MQVNSIRVSFQRKKQPAIYEEAAPAVEFAATLDDGEDHVAAAVGLLTEAQTIVYAGLGYGLPDKVSEALAAVSGNKPAPIVVESAPETDKPTEDAAETPEEPAEKPKKRGPGRPKGSKNTAPKKGTKAAEEAAAKGKAATAAAEKAKAKANDDGLPPEDDEDETDRQISKSPEDRKNPDDDGLPPEDDTDLPEEAAAATGPADEGYTAKDLHKEINEAYQGKKLSFANAKSILAHFRVARAQDLTPEQAVEGKAMLDKMLAASD